MDDHEVVVVLQVLRVLLVVAAVDLLLVRGQPLRGALQGVVDRLRCRKELVGAADDPPLGLEPGVTHQGDERIEDLRDTAAERSRGEVKDALALELGGEPADLLHQAA